MVKIVFTERGKYRSFLRSLANQPVFRSGKLALPKDDLYLKIAVDGTKQISGHTAVETLFHSLSDRKAKLTWNVLRGVQTHEYMLNKERFNEVYATVRENLDRGPTYATWLDVLFLLLVIQILNEDSDLYLWASDRFIELIESDERMFALAQVLMEEKCAPPWGSV